VASSAAAATAADSPPLWRKGLRRVPDRSVGRALGGAEEGPHLRRGIDRRRGLEEEAVLRRPEIAPGGRTSGEE